MGIIIGLVSDSFTIEDVADTCPPLVTAIYGSHKNMIDSIKSNFITCIAEGFVIELDGKFVVTNTGKHVGKLFNLIGE